VIPSTLASLLITMANITVTNSITTAEQAPEKIDKLWLRQYAEPFLLPATASACSILRASTT